MRRRLRVFALERGGFVEAGRDQVRAAVRGEEGVGEGEVAFADEEDAVCGGEGDGRSLRGVRAVCGGLERLRAGRFVGVSWWWWRSLGVWFVGGSFRLGFLCFAHLVGSERCWCKWAETGGRLPLRCQETGR